MEDLENDIVELWLKCLINKNNINDNVIIMVKWKRLSKFGCTKFLLTVKIIHNYLNFLKKNIKILNKY